MATEPQHSPYQCDRCASSNLVALPLLHQQGSRTYSGPTFWAWSRSYSAQASAPPRPHGYGGPLLLWGFGIYFALFWAFAGFSAIFKYANGAPDMRYVFGSFLFIAFVCFAGMIVNFRRVTRYNREIYPRLHWNWAHTYMCRRCGRLVFIHS